MVGSYHLEKCHNRRSRGCSLTSRSPQPQTDTTPAQAHDTLVQHGVTASYSRSQLQLSDSHQHHTPLIWEVVTLSLHIIHHLCKTQCNLPSNEWPLTKEWQFSCSYSWFKHNLPFSESALIPHGNAFKIDENFPTPWYHIQFWSLKIVIQSLLLFSLGGKALCCTKGGLMTPL